MKKFILLLLFCFATAFAQVGTPVQPRFFSDVANRMPATCQLNDYFTATDTAQLYQCGTDGVYHKNPTTAADVVSLFTGCNSDNPLLDYAGTCASASGSNPAGTTGDVQTNLAGAFGGDDNFRWITAPLADPSVAPSVAPTCTGTCGTSYGYVYVLSTNAGLTLPSPATTVNNAASLDTSHYNTVTLRNVPGTLCRVYRSTGPNSPQMLVEQLCDGSTFQDNDPYFGTTVAALPSANTTAQTLQLTINGAPPYGNHFAGIGFNGLHSGSLIDPNIGLLSPFPSQLMVFPNDGSGNERAEYLQYLGNGYYFIAPVGMSGFWLNVRAISNTQSPYQILANDDTGGAGIEDGVIRCDASAGNVTLNLPPTTGTDLFGNPPVPTGRFFLIHKPTSGNTCTLATTDGTLIDGQSSYVLSAQYSSVWLYWDGAGWPTANRISSTDIIAVNGTGSTAFVPAGSNCPATTCTTPYTWVKMTSSDGSTIWLPGFK